MTRLPFLSHWTPFQIEKIAHSFVVEKFIGNQIVYKQDDKSTKAYIVIDGEFEVTRQTKIAPEIKVNIKNLLHNSPQSRSKILKVVKRKQQKVKLATVSRSHILGHEDVMATRNYTTSVSCQSLKGSVYSINASEFVSRFIKCDRAWKMLQE